MDNNQTILTKIINRNNKNISKKKTYLYCFCVIIFVFLFLLGVHQIFFAPIDTSHFFKKTGVMFDATYNSDATRQANMKEDSVRILVSIDDTSSLTQYKIGAYEMGLYDTPEKRYGYFNSIDTIKTEFPVNTILNDEISREKESILDWAYGNHSNILLPKGKSKDGLNMIGFFGKNYFGVYYVNEKGECERFEVSRKYKSVSGEKGMEQYHVIISDCKTIQQPDKWDELTIKQMSKEEFEDTSTYFLLGATMYTAAEVPTKINNTISEE